MSYPFASALITGASSGIGEAMVHKLGRSGVHMVLVARRGEVLEALAARYDNCEVLVADLISDDGLAAVVERIGDPERPLDLVINNAGFGSAGAFVGIDPDRLNDEIALNITALTRISHAALSSMMPRRRGWLLNVSSIAGFQASAGLAVYAATKAYVTSLSESLHAEAASADVVVTALCPGLTRTGFQEVSGTEHFVDRFPGFVWTSAEQVALDGLAALAKGKTIAVPGAVYKGIVAATGVTPRPVARWLSGRLGRR
jgi:short-subunit dehydrogenase